MSKLCRGLSRFCVEVSRPGSDQSSTLKAATDQRFRHHLSRQLPRTRISLAHGAPSIFISDLRSFAPSTSRQHHQAHIAQSLALATKSHPAILRARLLSYGAAPTTTRLANAPSHRVPQLPQSLFRSGCFTVRARREVTDRVRRGR